LVVVDVDDRIELWEGDGTSPFETSLAGDEGLFPMPWMMALNFRFVAFMFGRGVTEGS